MERPAVARERNRAVAVLMGWAPFVLLLMAYELMRDAASTLRVPPRNLGGVERALFGGYEPTLVLQAAIGKLSDADLIDDAGSLVYSAHFLLPIVVGAWLWRRNRADFHRFGLSLVVLCALAFLTYVVAPTAPPWLAQPQSVQHLMQDAVTRSGLPPALTWPYSHHDYNLYAAFPSLHSGFPVLAAAAAWRRNRVAGVVGGILYAVVALAIVSLLSRDRKPGRITSP